MKPLTLILISPFIGLILGSIVEVYYPDADNTEKIIMGCILSAAIIGIIYQFS